MKSIFKSYKEFKYNYRNEQGGQIKSEQQDRQREIARRRDYQLAQRGI